MQAAHYEDLLSVPEAEDESQASQECRFSGMRQETDKEIHAQSRSNMPYGQGNFNGQGEICQQLVQQAYQIVEEETVELEMGCTRPHEISPDRPFSLAKR